MCYRRVNVDMETLQEMYVGALEDSRFDSAELSETHALDERTPIALNPRYGENCVIFDTIYVGAVTCCQIRKVFHCQISSAECNSPGCEATEGIHSGPP